MTTPESDNIEQEVDGAFRSAVTQAAALGRMVAQLREQAIQQAAQREEAMATELRRRHDAERQYARVVLSQADHDGWWNTASTERVANVIATAQAWKDKDPEIARLTSRVDDRAQARWGIRPTARIDELTPAQRQREAQQLMAVLSLDELDTDDPLRTFVVEAQEAKQRSSESSKPSETESSRDNDAEVVSTQSQGESKSEREETKGTRGQQVNEFEQLMRSNGLDQETVAARLLPERANAKPPQEAANVKSSTMDKPKNRSGLSQGRAREAERGR